MALVMIMTRSLLIYALAERQLRQALAENKQTILDQREGWSKQYNKSSEHPDTEGVSGENSNLIANVSIGSRRKQGIILVGIYPTCQVMAESLPCTSRERNNPFFIPFSINNMNWM